MVAAVQVHSAAAGSGVGFPVRLDGDAEYVAAVAEAKLMGVTATGSTGKRSVCANDFEDSEVFGKRTRSAPLYDITNGKGQPVQEAALLSLDTMGNGAPHDIDASSRDDPQACTSYVSDIYRNLRVAECKHRPSSCYMEQVQRDVNASMRNILVDWMVEVAEEYKLVPETLHLSVIYVDRYLSVTPVLRSKLQLVGVTCMLIASKYEEIYAPQLEEFRYITDHSYQRSELLDMERDILQALNFELTSPTIRTFIRRYLKAAQADSKTEFLAMYIGELALLEYGMLVFLPSQIAAAAVMLANLTLGKPVWNATLLFYTGYSPVELQSCVIALHKCFLRIRKAESSATRDKYSMHSFKCVSTIAPSHTTLPEYLFLFSPFPAMKH